MPFDSRIHKSHADYRLYLRASYLTATTSLGPKEADEQALDEYFQAQHRKHSPNADFREVCLYLHLRERNRRGHERAFHLNGHKTEDLDLMNRDQVIFSEFLSEWIDKNHWVAEEDETLNEAIAAMWAAHDTSMNEGLPCGGISASNTGQEKSS